MCFSAADNIRCFYSSVCRFTLVYTLSSADSNRTFLICLLMIDFVMPFRSGLAHMEGIKPLLIIIIIIVIIIRNNTQFAL